MQDLECYGSRDMLHFAPEKELIFSSSTAVEPPEAFACLTNGSKLYGFLQCGSFLRCLKLLSVSLLHTLPISADFRGYTLHPFSILALLVLSNL